MLLDTPQDTPEDTPHTPPHLPVGAQAQAQAQPQPQAQAQPQPLVPAPAPAPDSAPAPPPRSLSDTDTSPSPIRSPLRAPSPNPLESMFDNDNSVASTNGRSNLSVPNNPAADQDADGADDGDDEGDDDEKEEERLRALRNSSSTTAPAADSHKESDVKSADASKSSAKKPTPRSSHYSLAPAAPDVKYTPGMIVWAKVKGYPWWPGRSRLFARSTERFRIYPPLSRFRYQIEHEHELPANILRIKPMRMTTPHSPIYFCGTRDYGWQPHDLLRPFAEFRDELTERGNRTAAFLLAVREGNNPHLLNTLPDNAAVAVPASASSGSAKKQTKKRRDDDYDGADDGAAAGEDTDGRKKRKSAGGEKRGRKKAGAIATSSGTGADANGVDAL
ncbi:hypothetical protein HDU84_007400, partial [Entophlyctis sp. JEL0112]